MTTYVAGFLFGPDNTVALIRKKRPEWQAGRLNGIGGKVEVGEFPSYAMEREFREETGMHGLDWKPFVRMTGSKIEWQVWFFKASTDQPLSKILRSTTDEDVEVHRIGSAMYEESLPNLRWLIPLAQYDHDNYHLIDVREKNYHV